MLHFLIAMFALGASTGAVFRVLWRVLALGAHLGGKR